MAELTDAKFEIVANRYGKKIEETNINNWRRTVCGDLISVFRPYHGETIPKPEFLPKKEFVEGIHKAQFKKLPDDYKLLTSDEIAQINHARHLSPPTYRRRFCSGSQSHQPTPAPTLNNNSDQQCLPKISATLPKAALPHNHHAAPFRRRQTAKCPPRSGE